MSITIDRYKIEAQEQWRQKIKEIPFLEFSSDWKVKVIPPFAGAMARFIVSNGVKEVSVYLDMYDALGYYGEPHWEAYPIDDDAVRYAMNDTESLLNAIDGELSK